MASTGKKEYSIKINGVDVSIKEVTKLEDAVKSLDKTINTSAKDIQTATKASTTRAKALTDEEKAAKKLEATQKRINNVNSEANRAQIAANRELRERTREVTREIALNELAEGSIKAMGMTLTNLRNEYEGLTAEQRNNAEEGGKLLEQIQALDAEYKALRESTGNFRDSVGNYGRAVEGLDGLEQALNRVGQTNIDTQNSFISSNAVMGVFGSVTETASKAQADLYKILALVTLAQTLANAATKEGIVATTASAAVDAVKTAQLKAKTIAEALATKGTIAATIAQAAFNAVAYANPYVLLAMLLVAVVSALFLFASRTDDAAEKQKKLNEEQKIWLDYLDSERARLDLVSNARVKAMERQLRLLNAQGAETSKIRKLEDDIAHERRLNNARLMGLYHNEIEALEENRTKLAQYYDLLRSVQLAQARGDGKMMLDIDLNGKAEKVKVEEALDIVQGKIDNLNRSIEIAVQLKTDEAEIKNEVEVQKAERLKADKEEAKRRAEEYKRKAEEARRNAQERAALELEALRVAEDLKVKLLGSSFEQQRRTIRNEYARQIEDLKLRLKNETNLSVTARKAINDQIVNLAKVRDQELANLDKERAAAELETQRQLEDQRNALIVGQLERRRAEINTLYDRQIEDVKKRLDEEKDLTEAQRQALNEMVLNYDKQRNAELEAVTVESLNRRANLELQALESTLKQAQDKIGEVTVKNKSGIWAGVIDVDATRANLAASNAALDEYVASLTKYQNDLKTAHEATLATLAEGSVEYEEELQRYASANYDVTKKIKDAQKQQTDNTRTSTNLQMEYYKQLADKVAEYADLAAQAVTGVFDTWNMGLQASLDSLNEQLETINEHYEEAKEKREKYAEDVENIEQQLQTATGGTADALRSQLQDAMHLQNEAAREEQRLAKEKEKREAEIRKKEKQMKRNELISNIAMGIANTAQGVTKMLSLMWPLNLVMAGLVGVLGGVQVGLMTKQLTKLAKGGEIVGPSHENGGVRVTGTDIEVEGGEFVTNKVSYANNAELVRFINANPGTVTAADLVGLVPGMDNTPVVVSDVATSGEDRLVEAIESMEFKPVVSVTDIIDVTDEVTTVRDLSGF